MDTNRFSYLLSKKVIGGVRGGSVKVHDIYVYNCIYIYIYVYTYIYIYLVGGFNPSEKY